MPHLFFFSLFALIISTANAQSDKTLLYKAYNQNSPVLLSRFFEQWHQNSSASIYRQDIAINGLLTEFYKRENLVKMKQYDGFYKIYNTSAYLVLPDSVEVYQTRGELNSSLNYFDIKDKLIKEIKQIRPIIADLNKKVLYQDSKYEKMMDTFLQVKDYDKLDNDTDSPSKEKQKREAFLKPFVRTGIISSWGFDLTVITYPQIVAIFFNKDSNAAIVEFKSISGGGAEVLYKIANGKWMFSFVYQTWIE